LVNELRDFQKIKYTANKNDNHFEERERQGKRISNPIDKKVLKHHYTFDLCGQLLILLPSALRLWLRTPQASPTNNTTSPKSCYSG